MPAPHPGPGVVTRARAALLGLVAGNQLGVPTETYGTPEAIQAAFPTGPVDPPPPPKGSPYDDDAAMTLLLGESLVERGDFDASDVAQRWVKWMKVDGRGIGVQTRRALRLIERGVEPFEAGQRARQEGPAAAAGNGRGMRRGPVAPRLHANVGRPGRGAAPQAAVTHADEACPLGGGA